MPQWSAGLHKKRLKYTAGFSKRLRKAMADYKWSATEVANESGLSDNKISRLRNGSALPTAMDVQSLVQAFTNGCEEHKFNADYFVMDD